MFGIWFSSVVFLLDLAAFGTVCLSLFKFVYGLFMVCLGLFRFVYLAGGFGVFCGMLGAWCSVCGVCGVCLV